MTDDVAVTARVLSMVVENVRTHRFRKGRCYDIPDADARRIADEATAAAGGRLTADAANRALAVLEREIRPFAFTSPGPVGRRW